MERYFGITSIADQDIKNCLNAILFIANPDVKLPAHITVSGPFFSRPKKQRSDELVEGEVVSIIGVGRFLSESQCTIFLKCGFPSLRQVWNKKDFQINPHLTLYDGDDREFSSRLYDLAMKSKLFFSYRSTKLSYIRSLRGHKSMILTLCLDYDFISRSIGHPLSEHDIRIADDALRLTWIAKLFEICSRFGNSPETYRLHL